MCAQFFRTALHYAYGKTNAKPLVDLLLDYGASEFTMDKVSWHLFCMQYFTE